VNLKIRPTAGSVEGAAAARLHGSRYYSAVASARDPALARETLALTLTDELPNTIIGSVIGAVASSGEQLALAWDFVRANFDVLANKQSPFISSAQARPRWTARSICCATSTTISVARRNDAAGLDRGAQLASLPAQIPLQWPCGGRQ
jgi:hypothetical protein